MPTKPTMKVGPFTWRRDDSGGSEAWSLVLPADAGLSFFCVKNYGGKPNDGSGFTGWRLVSGGPFCRAGGWTSRDAAMRGVIPFLLNYYREQARQQRAKARRIERAVKTFLHDIKAAT